MYFFFNDTATTEIYTLSLHDALPIFMKIIHWLQSLKGGLMRGIFPHELSFFLDLPWRNLVLPPHELIARLTLTPTKRVLRSEEHTSELQSRQYLVCRLLLEKKKKKIT